MLSIRTAQPNDLREIEAIVQSAYSVYVDRMGKKPGPMLDDYAALIAEGRVHVLEDDGVAGMIVLVPEGDAMLLHNVAVSPAAQGKGYGRKLLAFAEDEARQQGFGRIRLYTNVLMTENIKLYSHLGYVETHRGEQDGFSRVFMEKVLP